MQRVQGSLNSFMALGKPAWTEARDTIISLLSKDTVGNPVGI